MADVVNRTTVELRTSVHTPAYSPTEWIINPDLSELEDVPLKYWKVVGDLVLEMTQSEKDAVDAAEIAAAAAAAEEALQNQVVPPGPLSGVGIEVTVNGLVVNVSIEELGVDEQFTFTSDGHKSKVIRICYLYDKDEDDFVVQAYEHMVNEYVPHPSNYILVAVLAHYLLPPNGTTLQNQPIPDTLPFGSELHSIEDLRTRQSTHSSWRTKITLNTLPLQGGTYALSFYANTNGPCSTRILVDGDEFHVHPVRSRILSGVMPIHLNPGTHKVEVQWRRSYYRRQGAVISQTRLQLWRIA